MMVCMAGLQVFIVRFFFQVRYLPAMRQAIMLIVIYRAQGRVTCELSVWSGHWAFFGIGGVETLCVLLTYDPEDQGNK
jgi:hypothetical protein